MADAKPKRIVLYLDPRGRSPFEAWFERLRDSTAQARIAVRIELIRQGLDTHQKSLGSGVYESKLTFGAGYRIYFGRDGDQIVVLLLGGTKRRQDDDIEKSKEYWKDYLEERHAKEK